MAKRYDVLVVGGGNAAFSAAHAAREGGGRVLVLEKAPREWIGGNSYFTAGAMRTTHGGLVDLQPILDDLSDEQATKTELPPYLHAGGLPSRHGAGDEGALRQGANGCPGKRVGRHDALAAREGLTV